MFSDVVLARSEVSLEAYFCALESKSSVRVVRIDLASVCRALIRKHFPNAQIEAGRFHVIRNYYHFLNCWTVSSSRTALFSIGGPFSCQGCIPGLGQETLNDDLLTPYNRYRIR